MRKALILLFLTSALWVQAQQPITGLNFNYWYDPQSEVKFEMHVVREPQGMKVYFSMITTADPLLYEISWEQRETYTQREGTRLELDDHSQVIGSNEKRGWLALAIPSKPYLLIAKIKKVLAQSAPFYFVCLMENNYPVNGHVEDNGAMVTKNYLTANQSYVLKGETTARYFVSYYNTDFPAASPPFAEKEGRVDRFLFNDSLFSIQANRSFQFKQTGLYLFQKDTTSAEGFAFRLVTGTFPKFTKIEDLAKPLIYVTTQDEFNEIQDAGNDKTKFDKVILDITKDRERAKNFMRSYFRRVELANLYFSSYKEGWKTDRGMVYIIFGSPDEVTRNSGSEIWFYKTLRTRLTFVRSGSIYNPENYVLLRDNRFMEPWYTAIDLWRKSRF